MTLQDVVATLGVRKPTFSQDGVPVKLGNLHFGSVQDLGDLKAY